jgi:hypothetical protein
MSPEERAKLVAGWIEHSTHRIERNEHNVFREIRGEDNFWAWEALDRLCRKQPDLCWEIILEILQATHHESVDWAMAAGPLEDLLAWHGHKFIERVEAQAQSDSKFKELLGGVWQNATPKELWVRVEAARGEPW